MKPSEQQDLYQRLGLEPSANPDEIKQAYRQMAFEWHPDRNPNDHSLHEEFIAVSQAYEVLSDYPTRREYDIERARAQPNPFSTIKIVKIVDIPEISRTEAEKYEQFGSLVMMPEADKLFVYSFGSRMLS